ncbi:MAG: TadE/TadG family type IV pilus assembly protein [Geminicoccaceae bacterium]
MILSTIISAIRVSGRRSAERPARSLLDLWSDRRGISTVHFALVLPMVLATILGTIDMGRLLMTHNTLVHAANEAARFAMVRSASSDQVVSEEDIVTLAKGRMTGLDPAYAVVSVNWIPENQPGAHVTVNVGYPYTMSTLGLGTINLKSSSSTFITH